MHAQLTPSQGGAAGRPQTTTTMAQLSQPSPHRPNCKMQDRVRQTLNVQGAPGTLRPCELTSRRNLPMQGAPGTPQPCVAKAQSSTRWPTGALNQEPRQTGLTGAPAARLLYNSQDSSTVSTVTPYRPGLTSYIDGRPHKSHAWANAKAVLQCQHPRSQSHLPRLTPIHSPDSHGASSTPSPQPRRRPLLSPRPKHVSSQT